MKNKDDKMIKGWLAFFIVALLISGLTAIPVNSELPVLLKFLSPGSKAFLWVQKVDVAYRNVGRQYPFLFYGYDWLAFAHFILAILFIGPWKDPVRNIWVIKFGLIACVLIFPFSFIAGHFRHIPFGWQLFDCSFGLFGIIPLWISTWRKIVSPSVFFRWYSLLPAFLFSGSFCSLGPPGTIGNVSYSGQRSVPVSYCQPLRLPVLMIFFLAW